MSNPVLKNIKTRRVVREMTDEPVSQQDLETILEAGRWSPTGSNNLPTRFLAVQDPELIELIRRVSPGIYSNAPLYIFVCVDRRNFPTYIDEETDDPRLPDGRRSGGADHGAGGAFHRSGERAGDLLQRARAAQDTQPAAALHALDGALCGAPATQSLLRDEAQQTALLAGPRLPRTLHPLARVRGRLRPAFLAGCASATYVLTA